MRLSHVAFATLLITGSALAQPGTTADAPELQRLYDEGVAALASERDAEAVDKLERVARDSVDPERRATASKLAAQARKRLGGVPPPPAGQPQPSPVDEEGLDGRTTFMGGVAALGFSYYGIAAPIILGVDDVQQGLGIYLLTAGGSIFVPYLLTRDEPVTQGMAALGTSLGMLGAAHGMLGYVIADPDEPSPRGLFAAGTIVSVAELAAGYMYARSTRMSGGHATAIGSGGLFGAGWGLAADVLINGDRIEDQGRGIAAVALGGSLAGLVLGDVYARNRRLSTGDAGVVTLGGMVGLYASVGPLVLADVTDKRAFAGTMLAGHVLGLIAGDRIIDGKDFSRSDVSRVALFTFGGALLGLGVAALASPQDDPENAYAASLSIGMVAGYVGGAAATKARPERARGIVARARRPSPYALGALTATPMVTPERGVGLGFVAPW